jgi:hypothetical protein
MFEDGAANPTWLSDQVHYDTATGSDEMAIRHAASISAALDASSIAGGSGGTTQLVNGGLVQAA